ncbi:MAG: DUF2271 domain-containing protein [Sphingomonadales bacterium]
MQLRYRLIFTGAPLAAFAAAPATAQTVDVSITVPRMKVAEYHAPYVAIWLEKAGSPARTLSIWYDTDNREEGGKKWLTDVRQWWRASGRSLSLPANGVSGATRAPGTHKMSFGNIAPGQYTMVVEAAREVGGREVVRVPFVWPPKPGQRAGATGTTELGVVALSFR